DPRLAIELADRLTATQPGNPSASKILGRIYAARNLSVDELDTPLTALARPDTMHGMSAAVALMISALQRQQRIIVVADFDVDGATSCALLLRGLRALGFNQVDYLVPNRVEDGYGLTPAIAD
ncbi:MAG: single-stranded-DNA-specific exonuclease RecJ, partial [Gammaproteobacteria bacterium]